jgi:cation diffusion facilitator family transporter
VSIAIGSPPADLEHGTRLRAGLVSLCGGIAILVAKLAAWRITRSTAVLSDALESFVNVAAGALLLYSLWISARPADRNHPYGHGKVEFFSAGVEGTLIAIAALLIGWQAVRALIEGPELRQLDVGLALVTAATAGNAAIGWYLLRVGRRAHSLALVADGKHLLTDVTTSAGVLLGLGLVRVTGQAIFDPLVALAVALQILWTGWRLTRLAVGGLMDEAEPATLDAMVAALESRREPWWIDAHSLRSWRSGPVEHVDLHLVVPRYFDADRLHEIDLQVEGVLLGATQRPGEAIVHFDPCRPRHCAGCAMAACPVRAAAFVARRPLTLERATRGDESLDTGAPVLSPARVGE